MHKSLQKITRWERYLTTEIGIEFKACLYFYGILFFYSMYRLFIGSYEASILHMAEIIFLTYIMGYIQVYLLSNFDEGENLGIRELFYMLLCSSLYTGASYLLAWFDRKLTVSIGFMFYILFDYLCTFLIYKCKRKIDDKLLNAELKAFQERR